MAKYDIASSMNSIMSDPSYRSIFAKSGPQFTKTAAKKEKAPCKNCDCEPCECESKEKKEKGKEKGKEKAKSDKKDKKSKKMTKYEACVINLAKISEMLDKAGLSKASAHTLLALDSLVKKAQVMQMPMDYITANPPQKPMAPVRQSVTQRHFDDLPEFDDSWKNLTDPNDPLNPNLDLNSADDCGDDMYVDDSGVGDPMDFTLETKEQEIKNKQKDVNHAFDDDDDDDDDYDDKDAEPDDLSEEEQEYLLERFNRKQKEIEEGEMLGLFDDKEFDKRKSVFHVFDHDDDFEDDSDDNMAPLPESVKSRYDEIHDMPARDLVGTELKLEPIDWDSLKEPVDEFNFVSLTDDDEDNESDLELSFDSLGVGKVAKRKNSLIRLARELRRRR